MKTQVKTIILLASLALLGTAAVVTAISSLRVGETGPNEALMAEVPDAIPGWKVTELKIADTERMQQAVDEQLNFDEALFREYKSGGKSFQIYAAYWRPRKMHPRLISIHVPDVCWVVNGWTMSRPDYSYDISLGEASLHHAQYRFFEAGGNGLNVLYWHLLDGRLSGYAEGVNSKSQSFLVNLWSGVREGAGEQFFIRLSSAQPWSELISEPAFRDVLKPFFPVLKGGN